MCFLLRRGNDRIGRPRCGWFLLILLLAFGVLAPLSIQARPLEPSPGKATADTRLDLSLEERRFLYAHPDIVFGTDEGWQPAVIRNDNGSLSGTDVEMLNLINGLLGTKIYIVTGRWPDIVRMAETRQIDGLTSSAVHPEREHHFAFTAPYVRYRNAIHVRIGNPLKLRSVADLTRKKIAYQRGNLLSQKILAGVPGVIAVAREKPMDLVNAIVSGEADALLSGHGLRFLMVQWGLVELEPAFYLDNPIDLVFSVRRDWPVLVSAIDKALAAIGEAQRLAVRS